MIIAALFSALIVAQPTGVSVKANYHDRLLDVCEDVAGRSCCRASVHAMRREQARLYIEEQGCMGEAEPMSLRCPSSLTWCSTKTRREIEEYHPIN